MHADAAGYGLGLAICQGLVQAYGGRIRAESDGPGRSPTVTFTLSVAGEPGSDAAAEPTPGRRQGEKARILVVDDAPHMLRSVRDGLAKADYAPLVTGELTAGRRRVR